jgi:hypothetical protein
MLRWKIVFVKVDKAGKSVYPNSHHGGVRRTAGLRSTLGTCWVMPSKESDTYRSFFLMVVSLATIFFVEKGEN